MNMTMSSKVKKPVQFPDSVDVLLQDNESIEVKGKMGELRLDLISVVIVSIQESSLNVKSKSNSKFSKAVAGTYTSLINNMIIGVSEGYELKLELVGVGYKVSLVGNILNLNLGYSHNIYFEVPLELKVSVESVKGKPPIIKLSGIDKQLIGQIAAKIKSLRPVEPYKGKGIKLVGEHVIRKVGKAAAAATS